MITGAEISIRKDSYFTKNEKYHYYITPFSQKVVIENEVFTSEKDGSKFKGFHISYDSDVEIVIKNCVFKNLKFYFDFFSKNCTVTFENCILESTELVEIPVFTHEYEESRYPSVIKFINTVVRYQHSLDFPYYSDLCIVQNSKIEVLNGNYLNSFLDLKGGTMFFVNSIIVLQGVHLSTEFADSVVLINTTIVSK